MAPKIITIDKRVALTGYRRRKPVSDIPPVTDRWEQIDGTIIRVCDMGDGHLVNAMRMMERNAYRYFSRTDWDDVAEQIADAWGVTMNGEIGHSALFGSLIEVMPERYEDVVPEIYFQMLLECARRGIAYFRDFHQTAEQLEGREQAFVEGVEVKKVY